MVSGQKRVTIVIFPQMEVMEFNKRIGRNVKRLRESRGLTQEQLADRLGVSSSLIPKWEAGTKGIGKRVLLKLATMFDVDPALFTIGEDAPALLNKAERETLDIMRKAEKMGVAEDVAHYGRFRISEAKKKHPPKKTKYPVPITFTPEEREALWLFERAEDLGVTHLLVEEAHRLLKEAADKAHEEANKMDRERKTGNGQ